MGIRFDQYFLGRKSVEFRLIQCETDARAEKPSMENFMAFVTWSLVGGTLGWLIKKEEIHRAAKSMGVHVLLGIVSAVFGGLLLGWLFPIPRNTDSFVFASDFVLVNVFLAIVGATVSFCVLQYQLPNRLTS